MAFRRNWQTALATQSGDIPASFLQSWLSHESGGNPCSVGKVDINKAHPEYGSTPWVWEAGIGQSYFSRPTAQLATLRAPCKANTGTQLRELTDEEVALNVSLFIGEARAARNVARQQVIKHGLEWSESEGDFWALVKSQHGLPGIAHNFLPLAVRDGVTTWGGFETYALGMSVAACRAVHPVTASYRTTPKGDRWVAVFNNARSTATKSGYSVTASSGGGWSTVDEAMVAPAAVLTIPAVFAWLAKFFKGGR